MLFFFFFAKCMFKIDTTFLFFRTICVYLCVWSLQYISLLLLFQHSSARFDSCCREQKIMWKWHFLCIFFKQKIFHKLGKWNPVKKIWKQSRNLGNDRWERRRNLWIYCEKFQKPVESYCGPGHRPWKIAVKVKDIHGHTHVHAHSHTPPHCLVRVIQTPPQNVISFVCSQHFHSIQWLVSVTLIMKDSNHRAGTFWGWGLRNLVMTLNSVGTVWTIQFILWL